MISAILRHRLLCLVLLVLPAHDVTASSDGLYEFETLVTDESQGTRQAAFAAGLEEIFIRVSGDSIIMDKIERPPVNAYVKQFHYTPVEQPVSNAQGEMLAYRLHVQYNGSLVEKKLYDMNFPVWGELRPRVVIWLAVNDGRRDYVLKDADASRIKDAVEASMFRRGVPEKWPRFDSQDRQQLGIADIRGGFDDTLRRASQRYGNGPVLSASMRWNGREWLSSWNLLLNQSTRHWSQSGSDFEVLIASAVDQAADILGETFAISDIDANQQLVVVSLDVHAVDSVDGYRLVYDYLQRVPAVHQLAPVLIDGQLVRFEAGLRSEESAFIDLIRSGDVLGELDVEVVEPLDIEALQSTPTTTVEGGSAALPANADYAFRLQSRPRP